MSIGDRIRRGAPSLVVVLAVVVLCGTTFGDDIFDVEAALAHLARISGKDQTMSVIASHVQCLIRGQAGGNIEFVNDGIYSHAKFDGHREGFVTVLQYAILKKEESIVELLMLVPGINVNRYNALWGLTPLMLAAWISNANMVKLLLGVTGIQVNARDIVGYDLNPREVQDQTVLHQAVIRYFEGHPKTRADYEIVEMLLQADGIDVNAQDKKKNTALHYAVFGEKEPIVELLVRVDGINVHLENSGGSTTWGWAWVHSPSTCFPLVDTVHKAEKRSKASSKAEKGSSSKSGWFRRRRG